ncbi:ankyrin [Neocallimastix lanati (nom. inval.)]|uniref:Ankyrin n=1 Tax=Neocallimastix californiae TaxID=1754190 RepID=A0A1Y2EIA4_9FUNG|nr:ankyrin [Neocallimastix sp. JGI-2020a]ORY70525.1 ankyrin [Neocallimastix californiae]|eukprot:ORY70525.1 ankyrin [Neocallimastix californiae]
MRIINENTNSSTIIKKFINKNDICGLTKYLKNNKNVIEKLITSKKQNILKSIFTTCKFNNNFILNLLLHYKNKTLTFSKLNYLLTKENKKITISCNLYGLAYRNHNSIALKILFESEIFTNKNDAIRKIIKYDLIKEAVKTRDVSFIRKILSYKNFNFKYLKYEEILYNVFKDSTSNDKIVELLIKSMLKNYSNSIYKNTILNIAIRAGNFDIFQYIIKNFKYTSKDINYYDIKKEYPIIVAMSNKKKDIFNYLLKKGANPNTKNNNGTSLLFLTIHLNKIDYIIPLVNDNTYGKIDVNAFDDNGYTPLIIAYINKYMNIFHYLIEYSNINRKDKYGHSILYYAINNGDGSLAKNLINIGAIIDNDIINIAIKKNKLSVILDNDKILLNSYKNDKNMPLLSELIISNCDNDDIEKIIKKGCNVNIKDKDGNTPLIYAVQSNRKYIAKLLIKYGAIKNIKNYNGKEAIDYSYISQDFNYFNQLLE